MRGAYRRGEVVERFSCGAGPDGWRYTSRTESGDTLDLTVDHDGLVRRLLADFDGWQVRGGALADELLWTRGEQEHRALAAGFTGESPAFDVAVARMLALAVGASTTVELVELTSPVGGARTVRQSWSRVPAPDEGVERYDVADLATGERWTVSLSGEVLLSREGSRIAVLVDL